ncbi:MAG: ubiquitin-like domain-containing protein [bacterium]
MSSLGVKLKPVAQKIDYSLHSAGIERGAAAVAVVVTIVAMAFTLTSQTKHSFRVFADQKRVVQLFVDGKRRVVVSSSSTVKDILSENGIELKSGDVIEPAVETVVDQPNYNINVYRALPAVVEDEGKFIQAVTGYRSARKIAAAAGVTLYPEDKAELSQVKDFQGTQSLGYKVAITRAVPVQLIVNGQIVNVRSFKRTVGEVLAEKGIEYDEKDLQGSTPQTVVTRGSRVVLAKISQETQTAIEDIAPGVQVSYDANLDTGRTQTKREGVSGRKQVTYLVEKNNGVETKRSVLDTLVLTASIDKIEIRGSKPTASRGSSSEAAAIGQEMAAARGWTGSQWDALYILWTRESNWNPDSVNRSSGACGIPQAYPCSKITDKSTRGQIDWGLSYIAGRYGTPQNALNYWYGHNSY